MQAVFDFDDTLFPTAWCEKHDPVPVDDTSGDAGGAAAAVPSETWKALDQAVLQLFDCLRDRGWRVAVVTNADAAWVMKAAERLPGLRRRLTSANAANHVELHSARDEYGSVHPWDEWKYLALLQLFSRPPAALANIAGFGDHHNDHDSLARACNAVGAPFSFFQIKKGQSPAELTESLRRLVPVFDRSRRTRADT